MIWNTAYKIVSKFYKAVNKTIRIIITTVVILLIVSGITAGMGWLLLHNLYEQSREEEYKILSNLNEGTFRRIPFGFHLVRKGRKVWHDAALFFVSYSLCKQFFKAKGEK